ncbi:hypothetical protein E4T56_gene9875 [Termitomyces sp. T112]|nr:hypothetical protein E4T56_gene9875 [Termitomyces sp. T112]
MFCSFALVSLLWSLLPQLAMSANLSNWEGPHIDVTAENRAIDWWYTQVISLTPAPNGVPPSIEVTLKHGNTFQYGSSNTPLYSVDINGFDQDGLPFAQTIVFNSSSVSSTDSGDTFGIWGANDSEITFIANPDRKKFTVSLNTTYATGTIIINSDSSARTGCGGTSLTDSPFFSDLVSDGRELTAAEVILYRKTGWRITIPDGPSTVDVVLGGKAVQFQGAGYKDSNWGPNAMNDFIMSWYVLIAQVGPWSFVTFSGNPINGTNFINSGHLSYEGEFVTSQCNIIGERSTDISIITPSGQVVDSNVIAPTAFDVTFVLPDAKNISFHADNIAVNPSVSVYHRWTAKYTGGTVGGQQYESYGITEWMNAGNISQWIYIQ